MQSSSSIQNQINQLNRNYTTLSQRKKNLVQIKTALKNASVSGEQQVNSNIKSCAKKADSALTIDFGESGLYDQIMAHKEGEGCSTDPVSASLSYIQREIDRCDGEIQQTQSTISNKKSALKQARKSEAEAREKAKERGSV